MAQPTNWCAVHHYNQTHRPFRFYSLFQFSSPIRRSHHPITFILTTEIRIDDILFALSNTSSASSITLTKIRVIHFSLIKSTFTPHAPIDDNEQRPTEQQIEKHEVRERKRSEVNATPILWLCAWEFHNNIEINMILSSIWKLCMAINSMGKEVIQQQDEHK